MYILFILSHKKDKVPHYRSYKATPHTFLIVSGLVMSLSLLLFIFYFTVSKTYVSITPQISIRPISANILYSQSLTGGILEQKNTILLKKIQIPIEHAMRFQIDTIDPNSATFAQGTVTLYPE
jgi:hypothetical protein